MTVPNAAIRNDAVPIDELVNAAVTSGYDAWEARTSLERIDIFAPSEDQISAEDLDRFSTCGDDFFDMRSLLLFRSTLKLARPDSPLAATAASEITEKVKAWFLSALAEYETDFLSGKTAMEAEYARRGMPASSLPKYFGQKESLIGIFKELARTDFNNPRDLEKILYGERTGLKAASEFWQYAPLAGLREALIELRASLGLTKEELKSAEDGFTAFQASGSRILGVGEHHYNNSTPGVVRAILDRSGDEFGWLAVEASDSSQAELDALVAEYRDCLIDEAELRFALRRLNASAYGLPMFDKLPDLARYGQYVNIVVGIDVETTSAEALAWEDLLVSCITRDMNIVYLDHNDPDDGKTRDAVFAEKLAALPGKGILVSGAGHVAKIGDHESYDPKVDMDKKTTAVLMGPQELFSAKIAPATKTALKEIYDFHVKVSW